MPCFLSSHGDEVAACIWQQAIAPSVASLLRWRGGCLMLAVGVVRARWGLPLNQGRLLWTAGWGCIVITHESDDRTLCMHELQTGRDLSA